MPEVAADDDDDDDDAYLKPNRVLNVFFNKNLCQGCDQCDPMFRVRNSPVSSKMTLKLPNMLILWVTPITLFSLLV